MEGGREGGREAVGRTEGGGDRERKGRGKRRKGKKGGKEEEGKITS